MVSSSSRSALRLTDFFLKGVGQLPEICLVILAFSFIIHDYSRPLAYSEACIKGHRSSSCHHADRPLYEIKKKGRPVSQCAKCRQARQSRRVHAKCTCADAELPESRKPSSSSSSSSRPPSKKGSSTTLFHDITVKLTFLKLASRFRATDPCLPNGLKDILESAEEPSTDRINPRQRGKH